jgi:hypothetical protein
VRLFFLLKTLCYSFYLLFVKLEMSYIRERKPTEKGQQYQFDLLIKQKNALVKEVGKKISFIEEYMCLWIRKR